MSDEYVPAEDRCDHDGCTEKAVGYGPDGGEYCSEACAQVGSEAQR